MTTVQELVLSGYVDPSSFQSFSLLSFEDRLFLLIFRDVATTRYQIEREISRMKNSTTYDFSLAKQNSLMHYAVLSGEPSMVKLLIELERKEYDEKKKQEEEFQKRVPKRKLKKQENTLRKYLQVRVI
jgi:hypothetical protein